MAIKESNLTWQERLERITVSIDPSGNSSPPTVQLQATATLHDNVKIATSDGVPNHELALKLGFLTGSLTCTASALGSAHGSHVWVIENRVTGAQIKVTQTGWTGTSGPPLPDSPYQDADNKALRKGLKQANDTRATMIGVAIAEANETAGFLLQGVSSAVSLVRGWRHKAFDVINNYINTLPTLLPAHKCQGCRVPRAKRPPCCQRIKVDNRIRRQNHLQEIGNQLADAWAGYTLGLSPLLADLDNTMTAARATAAWPRAGKKRMFGASRQAASARVSHAFFTGPSGIRYARTAIANRSSTVKYLSILQQEPRPSLARAWGLSAVDFLPTVYEAVPYSWLLSYVSNADLVIDALSHAQFSGFPWQKTTANRDETRGVSSNYSEAPAGWKIVANSFTPGTTVRTVTNIARVRLSTTPVPSFALDIDLTSYQASVVSALGWIAASKAGDSAIINSLLGKLNAKLGKS